MSLLEMIQRQRELYDRAKAAKREFTAEEQAEFDSLQRDIDEEVRTAGGNPAGSISPGNPAPGASAGQTAEEAERSRCAEIFSLCREFDVKDEDMQKYLTDGTSADAVRAAILNGMRSSRPPVSQAGTADVTADESDKYRAAASDALLMRSGIQIEHPADGARELQGMSLRDMAIESLAADGERGINRRTSDEIYSMMQRQFFNPTAAFPAILDQTIQKAYVEGHRTVAVTFDQWTKKGSLKDFKTADNNYLAGPAGEFLEVPEGSELKADVFSDARRPTRKLKTYGRQFSLTRQAFINDDIELITKVPAKYAASARKTINKQVYQILVGNPAIYDGTPLFSKMHGNLLTAGTGITQASMQAMIMALQTQKDEFGEAIIIRPAVLVVPSGMAFDIYTLFNSQYIHTSENTQAVNPLYRYANQIKVVEDPTINVLCGGFGNTMPWYLLGAKDDTDFIEVDYLNGQEIPNIRRMEVPGSLGYIWDIYLDWGISVMDWRGAIKNPGVKVANPLG